MVNGQHLALFCLSCDRACARGHDCDHDHDHVLACPLALLNPPYISQLLAEQPCHLLQQEVEQ